MLYYFFIRLFFHSFIYNPCRAFVQSSFILPTSWPCLCATYKVLLFPTFPWTANAAARSALPVEGALRVFFALYLHTHTHAHAHPHARTHTHQTYTNMAMPRPGAMQSSPRWSLYLLLLWVAGTDSSTLRLHPGQRDYTLPQNLGFFTIEANEGTGAGDEGRGGAAAAPALPLAARSGTESGSQPGVEPIIRIRRSSGDSTMPKVYGQVNKAQTALSETQKASLQTCPQTSKDALQDVTQTSRCCL